MRQFNPRSDPFSTGGDYVPGLSAPSLPQLGTAASDAWTRQPGGGGGPYFDDPLTQPIMTAWTRRMSQLSRPVPNYGADAEALWRGALKPDPRLNDALSTLQGAMKRSAPGNAYLGQYAGHTERRIGELNEEPFDAQEEARLKARFFDDLARTRDDRHEQLRARLSSMGMAPTSGTAAEAASLLEGEYETARAGQQRELLQYVADERNRRRDLAVQLSGALSGAGQADANNQASFEAHRAGVAGNLAQLIQALRAQQIGVGSNIAQMRRLQYTDDLDRGGLELETSALPASLAQARMAELQQTLNGFAPNAQDLYQQQLQQEQLQQNERLRKDQNRTALWGTVGQIAAPLLGKLFSRGEG